MASPATIDDLETLLLALDMHPMFTRQPFAILRLNLLTMKTDGLAPDLAALKDRAYVLAAADSATILQSHCHARGRQ